MKNRTSFLQGLISLVFLGTLNYVVIKLPNSSTLCYKGRKYVMNELGFTIDTTSC